MALSNFIFNLGSLIIIVALIIALLFHKKKKPFFFNYIFAFIIIGGLMSLNNIIAVNSSVVKKQMFYLEEYFALLQFLLLGLFFINIMKGTSFLVYIKMILLLTLITEIVLITLVINSRVYLYVRILSYLALIVFCFYYFYKILNDRPLIKLTKSSEFWIVTGIGFFSCVSLPILSFFPFLPKHQAYKNINSQIFSISNMSLIIGYLMIIKSYLCLIHRQNS